MKSWITSHILAIKFVVSRMIHQGRSTTLMALAIGVAMCLPGFFYLGINQANQFVSIVQNDNEISVFLTLDADEKAIAFVKDTLEKHAQVKQYRFINKAEAWKDLKTKMQNNANNSGIDILRENPLPHAFYVTANGSDPGLLSSLQQDLTQMTQVDHVLVNTDWSKRLTATLLVAKKIVVFFAALLAFGLIIMIGNTIRMQIVSQHDEIEVSYLIGATNSFIRTPFLYTGMLYGLLGGLVGSGIIMFGVNRFNHYIANLSALYNSDLHLNSFDLPLLLTIIICAGITGWLGAYFAVNHALSNIIASYKRH